MTARILTRLARAHLLRQMPNYVIAFVNGACNMRCSFCCDAAMSVRKVEDLSPAVWAKAFEGADALIHLTITGGEPFLRNDLADVVIGMVRASGVPRVSINSNGWRTQHIVASLRRILEATPWLDLTLSISLDGPAEIHDEVRATEGAFDNARKTLQAVGELRKEFPNLGLRVASVLVPRNASRLEAFLEETASWPINFHEIVFPRDVSRETQLEVLDAYRYLSDKQFQRASAGYRRSAEGRVFRAVRNEVISRVEAVQPKNCTAGGNLVEVMPDGRVVGCEQTKMKAVADIGTIVNARLVDIVSSRQAGIFRKQHAASCECTFECAIGANTVFEPLNLIRLSRTN